MAKHRQSTAQKWAPYVTTGIALNAATLFAFTYATDSHVTLNPLLSATTSIFVDGTKSLTGNEEGISPYRMADAFKGKYDQTSEDPDTADTGGYNEFVFYPRSLGPLTGLGDPTYDKSEGIATSETLKAIRAAKLDPDYHQGVDTIYVVGYSQGAGGVVQTLPELDSDEFADDDIQVVLAANPRRNDGGILARLPKGVYVPILGVSFGEGTTPTNTHVLQVTKQYDGVADAPNYLFNVFADLNAIMGYYYLHSGYYKDVDLRPIIPTIRRSSPTVPTAGHRRPHQGARRRTAADDAAAAARRAEGDRQGSRSVPAGDHRNRLRPAQCRSRAAGSVPVGAAAEQLAARCAVGRRRCDTDGPGADGHDSPAAQSRAEQPRESTRQHLRGERSRPAVKVPS